MLGISVLLPCLVLAQAAPPDSIINPDVSTFMANESIPGVAITLYYHGRAYFYNYGVANQASNQAVTSDTIFDLGSLTKAFTATLLSDGTQPSYSNDIFTPLGMHRSSLTSDGAIQSTAHDMLKFLEANLGIPWSGASPQLMQTMHNAQKGWIVMPNGMINNAGSAVGFSSIIALLPTQHIGVVILTTKSHDHLDLLATKILEALAR